MQQGTVTPGRPLVDRIYARKGTVGEQILKEIAHPSIKPLRHRRDFGITWIRVWGDDGCEICRGVVSVNGIRTPLVLVRGNRLEEKPPRTLVLEEVPGRCLSLKPESDGNGVFILRIGNAVSEKRVKSFAAQVVAAFVIHGSGWRNRRGKVFPEPYGERVDPLAKAKREAKKKARRSRVASDYDRYLW